MSKDLDVTFKTLLSKAEYTRLAKQFLDAPSNLQTNYYFDTPRFTLKASEIVLRVRRRENNKLELTLKRKKGYNKQEITENITEEQFDEMLNTKTIPSPAILNEISDVIKGQEIINFMSLSTFRIFFPYGKGKVALDRCEYLGEVDYELEYEATTYEQGKREFIELVKEFNIVYKKSEAKIKRAYNALKRQL